MKLSDILPELGAYFPASDHKERELPGGGRWFFIPWTLYLQRLNQVCPNEWEVTFSDPKFLESFCYVTCTLIVCGVSRQGIGTAKIEVKGERGNVIERAIAESLKNAGEMFSLGSYLDEQTDPKTKADFVRFMQHSGNGKAAVLHRQNEGDLPARTTASSTKQLRPFGQPPLTVVPPSKPAPTAPPTNLDRLRLFTKALGMKPDDGDALIKTALGQSYAGRKTNDLNPAEVESLRDTIAISYGRAKLSMPEAPLLELFLKLSPGLNDADMARSWLEVIRAQGLRQVTEAEF